MNLTPKQQELVDGLAQDLAPEVKRIESSMALTKNHYDEYGALISSLSKGNKTVAFFITLALIKAGGNADGVKNGFTHFC